MTTEPRDWLIRKRGYYYRPNRAGYTSSIAEAGRYTETEAKAEAAIEPGCMSAVQLSEVTPPSSNLETDLRAGIRDAEDELKSYGPRAAISVSAGWLKRTLELALAAIAPGPVQEARRLTLSASEAASFDKAFARSPRRVPEKTSDEPSSPERVTEAGLRHALRRASMKFDWLAEHHVASDYAKQACKQLAHEMWNIQSGAAPAPDVTCSCGHHERYHFDDGRGAILCRYADDCGCSRPAAPRRPE